MIFLVISRRILVVLLCREIILCVCANIKENIYISIFVKLRMRPQKLVQQEQYKFYIF
jgi:hypothetical protein